MAVRTDEKQGSEGPADASRTGVAALRFFEDRATLAELIAQIVLEAAGEEELTDILAAALRRLGGLVPFTGGSIALVDGDALVVRAAMGPFAEQALRQRVPRNDSESWRVVESGRPRRIDDLAEAGVRIHGRPAGSGIRSWIAAPLVRKGSTIGLVEVDSTAAHAFTDAHLDILGAVAIALSGPVEIANRYEVESQALARSESAQARLAFLADAGEVLASSLDYEATFASVAELAVARIADWCAVDLIEPGGETRLVALTHVDPERVRLAHRLREALPIEMDAPNGLGAVLRTGKSELISEIPDELLASALEGKPEILEIARTMGIASSITVPLLEQERVIGAISLVTAESGRRFVAADLHLVEELARRASLAIGSARLFREASDARLAAEHAALRNAQLLRITAELSTAVTQQEVAKAVVDRSVDALGAAGGWLARLSADGRTLELLAANGTLPGQIDRYHSLPIDAAFPIAVAARTGRPQWFPSVEAAIDERPELREALVQAYDRGRRALAVVPLVVGGRSIGALSVGFDELRDLVTTESEFLTALAQQCAQSLERARLYDAERDAREGAETIQSILRVRERQQAAVAEFGQLAVAGGPVERLFRAAVATIARTLDTEFVEILELQPERREFRLVAGTGWRRGLVGRAKVDAGAASQGGYTLISHGPVVVEDLATETRFTPSHLLVDHHVTSGVTVPIGRLPGPVWGVLGAQTARRASFTSDDVNFLLAVANLLASAVDRKRAEDERDRLLDVEREAQRRREAFIGVMSHELRTPITTIYAGTKFLARSGRGAARREAAREVLADVQAESERLYRLVEDLLVITKVERGRVEPAGEPLLLQRLLPRMAVAEQAASRDLHVEVDVPESLPTVRGEETYVEQVIRNYLSNARKYSPPGGTVRVTGEATEDDVIVRVLDEGPGFPADEGERLFELFYRSPSTAEKASGAGIGLFVSRQLVEAMGGRAWARPRVEGGAEFGFALPRLPEDDSA